jgi:hypothetical protein
MLFPASVALSFAIVMSCRYDWTYVEDEDGGNKDGGGTKDGSTSDTQSVDAIGPPNEAEPPPPPPTCKVGSSCGEGYYCAFSDQQCGKGTSEGACKPTTPCTSQTVCACDQVVRDQCVARKDNADFDPTWALCGLSKTFKCGTTPELCARGTQFCQAKPSGVPVNGGCGDIKGCIGCTCPEVKNAMIACGATTCDDKSEPGAVFVTCQ